MPLLQNQIVKEQSPTKFSSGIRPLGRESNRQKNQAFLNACLRPDSCGLFFRRWRSLATFFAASRCCQRSGQSRNIAMSQKTVKPLSQDGSREFRLRIRRGDPGVRPMRRHIVHGPFVEPKKAVQWLPLRVFHVFCAAVKPCSSRD